MSGYKIKYRTFNQLMEDVKLDFRNYSLEGMIEPQQLIKIARKINYDLGMRITKDKQTVLELDKGRVKLPDDFYILNYSLLCGSYEIKVIMPQGTHIEEVPCVPVYNPGTPEESNPCDPPPETCPIEVVDSCCLESCNGTYKLVQTINSQTRSYSFIYPLKLRKSAFIDCDCPNINMSAINEAWIEDGWLYANFESGNVYLNYQGSLEDEDGNLLVVDHELLNEYYEWALKTKILETLYFEGEDVERKLSYAKGELKVSRNNSLNIVNMPNFAELKKMYEVNRAAQYHRFYNMFKS